jgi:hypothetical protein
MNTCACCNKPLTGHCQLKRLEGYCDVVCFAAAHVLSASALKIWRQTCWKLDVAPTRPIS